MLAAALGGRIAEEITFSEITTGASNDLENATNIAKQMVTQYGMSDNLGPRTFGRREQMVFLGREISEQRDYSDHIAEQIDEEVHSFIQRGYSRAKEILVNKQSKLVQIAKYLMINETVEGEALAHLMESEPPAIEPIPSAV